MGLGVAERRKQGLSVAWRPIAPSYAGGPQTPWRRAAALRREHSGDRPCRAEQDAFRSPTPQRDATPMCGVPSVSTYCEMSK